MGKNVLGILGFVVSIAGFIISQIGNVIDDKKLSIEIEEKVDAALDARQSNDDETSEENEEPE